MREDYHRKIAQLIKENEHKDYQIFAFKNLQPELYSLTQYRIEEIIENLPYVCKDMDVIWKLLLETFGSECFTPNIVRKFPAQFQGDTKYQKEEINKFEHRIKQKILEFNKKIKIDLLEI